MNEEDLFAAAKLDIFGTEPSEPATRIARNMAIQYLTPLIRHAEAVQIGTQMSDGILATSIRHASTFPEDPSMRLFPNETKRALKQYTSNFCTRYASLLKQLDFKVA